jgi:hypothetical protein
MSTAQGTVLPILSDSPYGKESYFETEKGNTADDRWVWKSELSLYNHLYKK